MLVARNPPLPFSTLFRVGRSQISGALFFRGTGTRFMPPRLFLISPSVVVGAFFILVRWAALFQAIPIFLTRPLSPFGFFSCPVATLRRRVVLFPFFSLFLLPSLCPRVVIAQAPAGSGDVAFSSGSPYPSASPSPALSATPADEVLFYSLILFWICFLLKTAGTDQVLAFHPTG